MEKDLDWLGDLRWKGYPHPLRESPVQETPKPPKPAVDPRLGELARENEALRARLEQMARLAPEFERRLSEAGASYEAAALEAESKLRDAALEKERLAGELESLKAELSRLTARDAAREGDLSLERERRADAEKALLDARRRAEELAAQTEQARAAAAEQQGALAELRRQAAAQNERLLQSKALTDQDIRLLRQEMREFLAKFHRLSDPPAR